MNIYNNAKVEITCTLNHYSLESAISLAIERFENSDERHNYTNRFTLLPISVEVKVDTYRNTTEYLYKFEVTF